MEPHHTHDKTRANNHKIILLCYAYIHTYDVQTHTHTHTDIHKTLSYIYLHTQSYITRYSYGGYITEQAIHNVLVTE